MQYAAFINNLAINKNGLTAENSFTDQGDVLIFAGEAATASEAVTIVNSLQSWRQSSWFAQNEMSCLSSL